MRMTRTWLALAAGAAVCLVPAAVLAGDLWSGPATSSTETSALVLTSNPAGIGDVGGISTELVGAFGLRAVSHEVPEGETGRSTRFQGFPRLGHATDLGTDRWALGLAVGSPWGWNTSWPGDQKGSFRALFGQLTGVEFTPALAYSPLPNLDVGVSVSYAIATLETYRAYDFAPLVAREEGVDASSVPRGAPGNEGREHVDLDGATLGASAGVAWTAGSVRMSAAYHSPKSGTLSGDYELHIPHNEYYRDRYLGDIERGAELAVDWPGSAQVGVAFPVVGSVEADVGVTWRHWSFVDDVRLDVEDAEGTASLDRQLVGGLNDTLGADFGVSWHQSERLAWTGRLGFATSPLPASAVSRAAVEGATVSGRVGLRWAADDNLGLRIGYRHRHLVPREVGEDDAGFAAAGTYRQTMGLVEAGLSYGTE